MTEIPTPFPLPRKSFMWQRSVLVEHVGSTRTTRRRSRRRTLRVVVVAAVAVIVSVGAASAVGSLRDILGGSAAGQHGWFRADGERGNFGVHLTLRGETRRWEVKSRPSGEYIPGWRWAAPSVTGQYAGMTGNGRVVRLTGHKSEWKARLEGVVMRPGMTKQQVVIILTGRPTGSFTIRPQRSGSIQADSGSQRNIWGA